MNELKSYFQDKRNLVSLLSLLILTLALPLAIFLVRNQQIYSSRASGGPPIKFSGANVVPRAGKLVALNPQVVVELSAPYPPRVLSAQTSIKTANQSIVPKLSLVNTVHAQECGIAEDENCYCNGEIADFCSCAPEDPSCQAPVPPDQQPPPTGGGGGSCTDPSEFNQWGPCVSCNSAYFCCDSNSDICRVDNAYPGQCDSDPACTAAGGGGGGGEPDSCEGYFQYCEDNQGTQWCEGGSIQTSGEFAGFCGYDP